MPGGTPNCANVAPGSHDILCFFFYAIGYFSFFLGLVIPLYLRASDPQVFEG